MVKLQSLVNRKMDRKEFLLYLGFFILTITGISGILKNLNDPKLFKVKNKPQAQGFGSGPYGGTSRKENS